MKINNNNYILSIETTSNICGVSIIKNDKIIYEKNIDNGLNHSITLFNCIDNALKNKKLDMAKISSIKVSNGPGSFTGIRIGIAAALGLSKAYNTNIEYIDTLDALAYNVYKRKEFAISLIDAKVNRVYMSVYNSKTLKKYCNDIIIDINLLCIFLNNYFKNTNYEFVLIGSGAISYKNFFAHNLKIKYKLLIKDSNLKASSVAFSNGIESRMPIINYLLASKAEREKNDRS